MLSYPVVLTKDDNDTFLVTFPDVPEATSVGEDVESALLESVDGLEAALEFYFEDKRLIPMPSQAKKGQYLVDLPALTCAKVFLANEMLSQGVKKAELARRMDVHMPQIDRLLDLHHSSKIELVEKALGKLGRKLNVSIA